MQASHLPLPESPAWSGTDRYSVVHKVGEGGMGIVYEAIDRDTGRAVALKTLLRFDAESVYRFKREFRALADVHHRNLVRLHELVQPESGPLFFTMELVRGNGLPRIRARRRGRRTEPDAYFAPVRLGERNERHPPSLVQVPAAAVGLAADAEPGADSGRPGSPPPRAAPARGGRRRAAPRREAAPRHQAVERAGDAGGARRPPRLRRRDRASRARVERCGADGSGIVGTRGVHGARAGGGRGAHARVATGTASASCSTRRSSGAALRRPERRRPHAEEHADEPPPAERVGSGVPPDLDCAVRRSPEPRAAERPDGAEILRRLGAVGRAASAARRGGGAAGQRGLRRRAATSRSSRAARGARRRVAAASAVTVRVGGASGMGKSTLVQHFLDDLAGRRRARDGPPRPRVRARGGALQGRRQRWSTRSRRTCSLARGRRGTARRCRDDVAALARLFPVLRRVPAIVGARPTCPSTTPQRVRRRRLRRAARARSSTLARRQPLVLFIDDAQWGDVDSAALLLEVMRAAARAAAPPRHDVPGRGGDDERLPARDAASAGPRRPTCATSRSARSIATTRERLALALLGAPTRSRHGRRAPSRASRSGSPVPRRGARTQQPGRGGSGGRDPVAR